MMDEKLTDEQVAKIADKIEDQFATVLDIDQFDGAINQVIDELSRRHGRTPVEPVSRAAAEKLVHDWWHTWMDDEKIEDIYKAPVKHLIEAIAKLPAPQPVAETVSREMIDINGREVESAVDEAWESNAVDSLGVEQRSMTYREFVTAGYQIAKAILAIQPPAPQPVSTGEYIDFDTHWNSSRGFLHWPSAYDAHKATWNEALRSAFRPHVSLPVGAVPSERELRDTLVKAGWPLSADKSVEVIHAHLLATTKQAPDVEAVVDATLEMFRTIEHASPSTTVHEFCLSWGEALKNVCTSLAALKNGGKL